MILTENWEEKENEQDSTIADIALDIIFNQCGGKSVHPDAEDDLSVQ